MTLGDLLRQDGAFALLAIGAVLGFFAGMFFRGRAKGKERGVLQAAQNAPAPPAYAPAPVKTAAVVAAIAAAVNKYQSESL